MTQAHRRAHDAAHPASEGYRKPDSGLSIYAQFLCLVIYPDLRCALAGRQFVYSLPPAFYYPLLTMFLRLKLKTCKMTMQGYRNFKRVRKKAPQRKNFGFIRLMRTFD